MAELLGPLSLATDAANGVGPETAMRTAVLAAALARAHGLAATEVRAAYWSSLLRFLGCTSFAHETARYAAGEDQRFLRALLIGDASRTSSVLRGLASATDGHPVLERGASMARVLFEPDAGRALVTSHCDAAAALAADLGADASITAPLAQAHERFDGRGQPHRLRGDAIGIVARVMHVAHRAELHRGVFGADEARDEVARRAGSELDPALARTFASIAGDVLPHLGERSFALFVEAEPAPRWLVEPAQRTELARAFARFSDLKSPFTLGHSVGVAALCCATARQLGLDAEETNLLEQAALLHDVGRAAIPNSIWDAPRALDRVERDRVQAHAEHTARIVGPSLPLAAVADIAGAAHARLDGSGYPRATPSGPAAHILEACDVIHALGEDRAHRLHFTSDAIAALLAEEVAAHRLDGRIVEAGLAARGIPSHRPPRPDGLSDREVEVLALLARGQANKEIAAALGLSPKTVQHHVAHVYEKTGVKTRAAAALYAVRHRIVGG